MAEARLTLHGARRCHVNRPPVIVPLGPIRHEAPREQPLSETVGNILEETWIIFRHPDALRISAHRRLQLAGFTNSALATRGYIHLGATMLVALATAMLIAPAAYHRIADPETVFSPVRHARPTLLSWSLVPLAIAICADVYLVAPW